MDGRLVAAGIGMGGILVLVVGWIEHRARNGGIAAARFAAAGRRAGLSLALPAMLFAGTLAQLSQPGIGLEPVAHAQGLANPPTVTRFSPLAGTRSVKRTLLTGGPVVTRSSLVPQPIQRGTHVSMAPGLLALLPGQAAHFTGSDGRLTVDVPAAAVSVADIAAAGGKLAVRITQIDAPSGSNAGGSGHVSLGSYLVQVVNAQGVLAGQGLRAPITLTLHYGSRGSAIDLSHAVVLFNLPVPEGTESAPNVAQPQTAGFHAGRTTQGETAGTGRSAAPNTTAASMGLGPYSTQPATLDTTQHTLSATGPASTASTSATFSATSPVATFGSPDPFTSDLSGGGLTATIPPTRCWRAG